MFTMTLNKDEIQMKISLLVCVLMRCFNDVKVVEFVTYCIMSASDSTVRGSKRSAASPARCWRDVGAMTWRPPE